MSSCTRSTTPSRPIPRPTRAKTAAMCATAPADILSTGTSHPSPRLSDSILDVGHDDYYDHSGTWWDIRDSGWLVHLESPPGMLTIAVSGSGGAVTSVPDGGLCTDTCTTRYDGGSAVRLIAIEHSGYRLLSWGGTCSGVSRTCDTTVESEGVSVAATFGPAVTVTARTLGPGHITQLDGVPCTGECALDLIPGSQVVMGAEPAPGARFVGWRGLCSGSRPTCTVAVSLSAVHPAVTAVFRDVSRPQA